MKSTFAGMPAEALTFLADLEKNNNREWFNAHRRDYDENVLSLYGLADGGATQLTARGALRRDGEAAVAMVVNMSGVVKGMEPGDWSAGEQTSMTIQVALRYLKITIGGREVVEIDKVNMIRRINGADQLESIRTAIGV